MSSLDQPRCSWASNELSIRYHDDEWGVPVHDDNRFFEFLILEGAQAGLSWDTILKKRDEYRRAFSMFDPAKVARFNQKSIARLLTNPGIVRNRLKIAAAITNAKATIALRADGGLADFVWSFRPERTPRPSTLA